MMIIKKILLFILMMIFFTGCSSSSEKVGMILEKNKHSAISIHYPVTNIKKMDKKIQKYVEDVYQTFKNNEKYYLQSELNIDYTYFTYQKIQTTCLKTYIYTYRDGPKETVHCITYDAKRKKELYLKNIIEQEKWESFLNLIKSTHIENYDHSIFRSISDEQLEKLSQKFTDFTFDSEQLIIFFKNDQLEGNSSNNLSISLNLDTVPLTFNIKKGSTKETLKKTETVDFIIDPTKPAVALTFDDGPTEYTDEILDILQKENVSATFFVLGNKVDLFQYTLRRMVKQGNEIGNHSYNHKWLSRLSTDEIKFQIEQTQDKIKNITGIYPRFLRPTYGSINNRIRNATDLNIVLWDIDPKDWKKQSSEKISQRILDKVDDGKIILLHDNHKRTVEAVKILILKLKEKGYQMVTLSDMEEIQILRKVNH